MISLEKSIWGCKIDQGWASRMQSDRFENPDLMLCPVWNSQDTAGRQVCPDSFYTKRAGCNSAMDRILVENNLRPQYAEYITLGAQGIAANGIYDNTMENSDSRLRSVCQAGIRNVTGNFGLDLMADTAVPCNMYSYENAMSQVQRQKQQLQHGYEAYQRNNNAGFQSTNGQCGAR
jgi:hypothetical protein